jgi:hypothetical protein
VTCRSDKGDRLWAKQSATATARPISKDRLCPASRRVEEEGRSAVEEGVGEGR